MGKGSSRPGDTARREPRPPRPRALTAARGPAHNSPQAGVCQRTKKDSEWSERSDGLALATSEARWLDLLPVHPLSSFVANIAAMAELVEKELSYAINRSLFEVHNQVGPGLREECYQHALAYSFRRAGIAFQAKPATRTELIWKSNVVDIFEPDFIVADRVVVELKHQPEGFARKNDSQVLTYLKHFRLPLGILVNCALDKVAIRRLPYTERTTGFHQDLQQLPLELTPRAQQAIGHATQIIAEAHAQFGVGYPGATYRNLLLVGLRAAGVACSGELLVAPRFGEIELPTSRISPTIVEGCLCLETEAVLQGVSARAIRTMQTHLQWTGCEAGLIACFDKQRCEIRGVRPRYQKDSG